MKTIIIILAIIALYSCSQPDCQSIHDEYTRALQNARTQEAVDEITRQYNDKLNENGC